MDDPFEMICVSRAKVEPLIQAEIDDLAKTIPADAAWRERAIEAITRAVRLEWTHPEYVATLKARGQDL